MRRDPSSLSNTSFDLVVVGGGISGAFVAWDAALRGLRVALVDKADFGHATSAASGRVIHGGLRHLPQGALGLLRESYREREVLRRIAPHLLRPLDFLIPTYGHLARGKAPLLLAMWAYSLARLGSLSGSPGSGGGGFRVVTRQDALDLAPGLERSGLTGGVVYPEWQVELAERLTLAVVRAAANAGAVVANYVEATKGLWRGDTLEGIEAKDRLSKQRFEIRARITANMSGPWGDATRGILSPSSSRLPLSFAKGVHIVTRSLTRGAAVALVGEERRSGSLAGRGGRHFFIMPWRERSLIGATNSPFAGAPDEVFADRQDIDELVAMVRKRYPGEPIDVSDVDHAFAGLYSIFGEAAAGAGYEAAMKPLICDHSRRDGVEGLISAIAVKYTTARHLGEKVVDLALLKLGGPARRSKTGVTPVDGGDVADIDELTDQAARACPVALERAEIGRLARAYGTRVREVLELVRATPALGVRVSPQRPTLAAEVIYAVREEMAVTLSDIIFRRTDLGILGDPGPECLRRVNDLVAAELGWGDDRRTRELDGVRSR